jgi:diguanylate cyclase (GGDEF)-like protein/PAS domain S-box-containing protein
MAPSVQLFADNRTPLPSTRIDRFQTLLAMLLVVGSGCLIAAALVYSRMETVAASRDLTRSIVQVMAEQNARTLQAVDQKMQYLAAKLARMNDIALIGQRSTDLLLRDQLVGLALVRSFRVTDARGRVIAASDAGYLAANMADTGYFRAYQQQPDAGFFLDAPVRQPGTGAWLITAAYPLRDGDGALLGILTAALDPRYFEKLWRAIDLGPDGTIDLYRRDGILMASSAADAVPGRASDDGAVLAAIGAGVNVWRAPWLGGSGASERMLISRALTDYPQLTLVARRSFHALLSPWRRFSMILFATWLAACAFIALLYALLRKTWLQHQEAAETLRVSEQKFSAAFRASPDAILITRADDGKFVEVSDSATRLIGYARDELVGHSSLDLDLWRNPAERERYVNAMKTHGRVTDMEAEFRNRSGETRIGQMSGELIMIGGAPHILGIIRDITDTKRRDELIWKQARFDPLTQLPNRIMFVEQLRAHIDAAQAGSAGFSLLMLDLDQFKEVNDTLGHSKGDQLLLDVARRITDCVPAAAIIARLGGDEFAIILRDPGDGGEIDDVLACLVSAIHAPFMLDQDRVFISVSVGVARFPDGGADMAELLRHADQAMYAAKHSGRNRYCHFHPGLQDAAQERAKLTADLRTALLNAEFELYYQPIVELATGRIRKAEALLRWNHPQRGQIGPAEFIALAETSGLIVEIGEWVFEQAARQAHRMRAIADAAFQISVNVSPVQIHSNNALPARWLARLHAIGLAPDAMALEITEGVLLDLSGEVEDALRAFTTAGAEIALDDFGTGYSSLAYLRKFDIDYLKIDRSFVHNVDSNPQDLELCEAIVAMAHKLGLKVIVEGIETARQHDLMRGMDCDFGQGYFFSVPTPAHRFEALVQAPAPGGRD